MNARSRRAARLGLAAALALGAAGTAAAQHSHAPAQASGGSPSGAPGAAPPARSVRITMEGLHAAGGTPPGWRFTLPPGDAEAGRRAFVDLRCYACHAIKGEQFPLKPGDTATAGPDLTGMGAHHPPEYLAESIVNPSAVLVEGPGYIGADGRSIMPETPGMTVAQLVDLVAYLKGQGREDSDGATRRDGAEQEAGRYRVRLRYVGGDAHAGPGGGHAHHHGAEAPAGRLVATVVDRITGQPVPYLPVRARIEVPGRPPATVALAPQLGPDGLTYGATTAAPARARRIVLTVGAATARLVANDPGAFARAHTVTFDWR